MDRLTFLKENSTFSFLPLHEMEHMAGMAALEERPAGSLVFKQGEPGEAFYIIASGRVKVFITNDEGAEVTVAQLGPGDSFGEMALLTGEPRSASVQAEENAQFLILQKNDFDQVLEENPRLARVFLDLVCRRLSQANLRMGQEAARESALRELLEEETREPVQILGSTRQALQLRTQAERAAANDQPLLIIGEPGTEKRTVAQLVHQKSHRANAPFLCLDCADVPAVVPQGAEGEAAAFLQEVAQISALFGHQRGAFSFARTNRLGYLELAEGGTVLLENVERLTPAVQERLLAYLRSGRLQPLGDFRETPSNVRIIATSHPWLERDVALGTFNAELHALLSAQTITVPPLRERKKDLTAWVDHLIRAYGARLAKEVRGITPEAMNLILAYDWPDNMEELEAVVQRGVRLADGPTLTPEQIFIGLAPFESRRKANLLKLPLLRRALESPLYPGLIQAISVGILGFILLSALLGPQRADSNLALVLVWVLWWPLLVLGIFFTARFFCGICPMGAIGHFLQQRWSLRRKVPGPVKQHGLYGAAFGFLVVIWVEQVTGMMGSPLATAFLLLAILAGAVGASLVFDRAAWCRYMCPMGRMIGAYATLSLVEMRTNNSVCTAECKTHGCYTGTERARGCPMYEGAFALQSNEACKICADCIKSCANRAVRLNLRLPASEVWTLPQHSLPVAGLIPILIATILGIHLRDTVLYREWLAGVGLEWLAYLGVLLVLAAALWGAMALAVASLRAQGEPLAKGLAWLPYAFLPLALAGEMSHQMAPFLSQAGTFLPTLARQFGLGDWQVAAVGTGPATPGIQAGLLALGLLASLYLVHRLVARYRPSAGGLVRLPAFLLAGLLTLSYGLLFFGG